MASCSCTYTEGGKQFIKMTYQFNNKQTTWFIHKYANIIIELLLIKGKSGATETNMTDLLTKNHCKPLPVI